MSNRLLAALVLILIVTTACADQIDYFFQFTDAIQAQADLAIAQYYVSARGWNQSVVFENIQVWKPTQDQTVTNPFPPPPTLTTHKYLAGYYIIGSFPSPVVPAALSDVQIVAIIDRDTNAVIKDNLDAGASRTNLNALMFSPTPEGSHYSFGAFQ